VIVAVLIAALAIAGLTTAYATPLVRKLAIRVGMVDDVGERRMHQTPIPRIGGVALYLGFAFALFSLLGYLITKKQLADLTDIHNIVGLLFGGTLILMVGLWDDVMGMRPRNKLVAQIVVAGISLLYGFRISTSIFRRGFRSR
jgi:UDP-GlcNAc:undecaprenyl-phosphate GlcNAc-1-phosphate transferase